MSLLLLSPHRDDAAFSCGLLLASAVNMAVPCCIVNVCTVSDYAPYADIANDALRIRHITALRAEEDQAFLRLLHCETSPPGANVRMLDCSWKDAPLRRAIATEAVLGDHPVSPEEVRQLAHEFRQLPAALAVLAPLALGGHMDHLLVREAALAAWPADTLVFYEDLPYSNRMPQQQREAEIARALPWPCQTWLTPPAQGGRKRLMASLYPSQIAGTVADEMELYAAAQGYTESLCGTAAALRTLAIQLEPVPAAVGFSG